jgi:hypothetical protein
MARLHNLLCTLQINDLRKERSMMAVAMRQGSVIQVYV